MGGWLAGCGHSHNGTLWGKNIKGYQTEWTSQKWAPHTPDPGELALCGLPPAGDSRHTSRYTGGAGGEEMAFHSRGVGVGVGRPWEGQRATRW